MNHPRIVSVFSLLLWLPLAALAADSDVRATLFSKADALLEQARAIDADVLAPRSFSRGLQAFQDAEGRLQRGQALDKIRSDLEQATASLTEAIGQAETVTPLLASALKARKDAKTSGADTIARSQFEQADNDLQKVTADLERGRTRNVKKSDQQLAGDYRSAELAAIKHRLLSDTRSLFAEADNLRAERYAPITLAKARQLLTEADRALSEDRYDADRPRSLAKEANLQARHAIYLTKQLLAVREDRLTTEQLLHEWEAALTSIADAGDMAVYFDEGPQPPAQKIVAYIRQLQAENAGHLATLSDREQQIEQMNLEIQDLEKRLGGVASERSALQDELARQEQMRLRFLQIEAMFLPEEAVVIRESGKITLRLTGLKFAVGKSDIEAENFPLLAKVQSATRIFPGSRLVVEGHTDSFGSDQKNMELSRDRAESVRQYLLANLRINPGLISAVGHGEEKPIANNETAEGRSRNRRIELLLFPDEGL